MTTPMTYYRQHTIIDTWEKLAAIPHSPDSTTQISIDDAASIAAMVRDFQNSKPRNESPFIGQIPAWGSLPVELPAIGLADYAAIEKKMVAFDTAVEAEKKLMAGFKENPFPMPMAKSVTLNELDKAVRNVKKQYAAKQEKIANQARIIKQLETKIDNMRKGMADLDADRQREKTGKSLHAEDLQRQLDKQADSFAAFRSQIQVLTDCNAVLSKQLTDCKVELKLERESHEKTIKAAMDEWQKLPLGVYNLTPIDGQYIQISKQWYRAEPS